MGVCLRVLEASTLALSARELELYGRLRLTPTVADCWQKTFLSQCDSMTSGRYVESNTPIRAPEECDTLPGLTSSAEDSPVRTSPMPGSEPESTGNARDCGASLPASFASYDPATSSWRTSQLCLDGEWSVFSETWPRAGMTRSGRAFELPTLVHPTEESESGLWPTPAGSVANLGEGLETWEARRQRELEKHRNGNGFGTPLTIAVQMFPTPRTPKYGQDMKKFEREPGRQFPSDLETFVHLWRTPSSRDWKDTPGMALKGPNGRNRNDQLARRVFSTPRTTPRTAMEYDGETALGNGGLNPTWVEWLMGFPLGWTALEDSATPSSRKSRNGSGEGS